MRTQGGFLISQIKQIQARIFERLLAQRGIGEFNGAQGRILYVLWQHDDIPITELARKTGLAKTTLTGMLDRMQAQDHVERFHDAGDRRQVRIRLTPRAQALSDAYDDVSREMNEIFYRGFTDREIGQLESQLARILGNLQQRE